ncbi:elongation factor P 5-aminopentanone reductase [Latilactobacillus graminis]|uniref:Short chain dehydrogenase family protein n=2 Tax=Latilactobacillus graminis TaxID=60519 RepID=A0AA89L361_9LACO|nr:SDR family NAD(P)-dependent oxidoreductase [Latilactobacillus graminis]KRM20657.1 short chain dehydrogenase family protein [Latilactobacillus graminis DSM 20719]QFP79974.1 SDR family oxidoreductase [Latilactobacillus graminis]
MHKAALIIGASGDIGTTVAMEMAAAGWSLYLHYNHNRERVTKVQAKLTQMYPQQDILTIQADLTQAQAVAKITGQLFQVDAVIYAAGETTYGLLPEISEQSLEDLWQIHVKALMLLMQQLQGKLAQSSLGRVVLIGSIYGGRGSAMEVPYSTVKGAQSAFVNAYAQEVASLGITINVVAPGAVATKMNNQFTLAERAAVAAEIPVGAFATPTQIAYWVLSLMAPAADYMTGQTLYVNGGWLK